MKKILSLVTLVAGIALGANAQVQRQANIATFITFPTPSPATTINCVDSYMVQCGIVNLGPDIIYPTDTLAVTDGFISNVDQGYAYPVHGDTIHVGDTLIIDEGYFKEADLQFLVSSTGTPMYDPPFANGNYFFPIRFVGYGWDTTSVLVVDPNDTNNIALSPIIINCPTATSIHDAQLNKTTLSVFPNPAQNEISFKNNFAAATTTAQVRVTDIAGRVVKTLDLGKQNAGERTFTIDISDLNNGMYYIELVTDDSKGINKFTKN